MRRLNVHLTLTIGTDEIVDIVSDMTPLRIDLGRKRSVSFGRPEIVELVPNTGLRIRGDAKMVWELAGVPLPVTLRTWQLLLVPSVVRREGVIYVAFDPILEDLDFKSVPGFFDERLIDAINEGVASQRGKLRLNVTRMLGSSVPIPARVAPGGSFDVSPIDASVVVMANELRIEIDLRADVNQLAVATPRSLRTA